MIATIALSLAAATPQTTVEMFNCDFVRISRFDKNDQAIMSKKHFPLMIFIRRQSNPQRMADVIVLKTLDPSGFLRAGAYTGFIDSEGGLILQPRQAGSAGLGVLVKAAMNGKKDREAWVLPKQLPRNMSKTLSDSSPLFIGGCNTAAGPVAEKILKAAQ